MITFIMIIIITIITKMISSETNQMEDVLADFLKADALISAMEEKLEIM